MFRFIRSILISFALITLLVVGALAQAQDTATDVACINCVDTRDIAFRAVTDRKLSPKAVVTGKIADGAVTTAKIKDAAVTQSKIAPDAVGIGQIDPTQVQIRVGGTCSIGSFVAAIGEDGSVTCGTGTDVRRNTSLGDFALESNTTGLDNTASGYKALRLNTIGSTNTAYGSVALVSNNSGNSNTAIGYEALTFNVSGNNNTGNGHKVLQDNTTGSKNTATGVSALQSNTTGRDNTAIGVDALSKSMTGHSNIAVGHQAGFDVTGSDNIAIGNKGVDGESATIRIGDSDQTRAFMSGIRGATTGIADAISVFVDSAGQLGTVSSSARYKQDIENMGAASDRLLQLRPVTFRYQKPYESGEMPLEYGLIAEEVAEVFPELIVYNAENNPEAVKYRLLSSLLLNELQKQNADLKRQEGELAALNAQVSELYKLVGEVAQVTEVLSRREAMLTDITNESASR